MTQANGDADALLDFLGQDAENLGGFEGLDKINDRELDPGEKATDAQDFSDIDEDDLPDDDEAGLKPKPTAFVKAESDLDDDDDLFGEPISEDELRSPEARVKTEAANQDDVVQDSVETLQVEIEESEEEDDETREQRLLFAQAAKDRELRRGGDAAGLPPPPPTDDELFYTIWPQFELNRPPRFGELLPQKKAYYLEKTPLRPPKPVNPSKVNLELEPDQEKAFRLPAGPQLPFELRQAEAEAIGIVLLAREEAAEQSDIEDEDTGLLDSEEGIGGVTWQDLVALCEDWDIPSPDTVSIFEEPVLQNDPQIDDLFLDDDFDTLEDSRPAKRTKLGDHVSEPLRVIHNLNTAFEDPEKATARLAKKVNLDLNDPYLFLDVQDRAAPPPQKRTLRSAFNRDSAGGLTKSLAARYNISNDNEYDLLKQNHQNKIRSQIGNTPLEHATAAVRLQYPFYKQELTTKEKRSWHRPSLHVIPGNVTINKPASHKRKFMRGKEAHELFKTSGDLTLGDNSSMLLLEYSEEHPPMLSTSGMGSRLINYYRRKDAEDTSRPKLDIGESSVLLPQDQSPFDKFGFVDKGQVMPTISNAMYRAPVFKHDAKPQDFLVSKSTTGLGGPVYVFRNIENLHAVGQEYPLMTVPGPKARAATNVGKFRLHMLAYRMYNKKPGRLTMDDIRKHNPVTDMPTIRTKMKEFMEFDKSAGQGRGVWRARREPPTEAEIRTMVKPDDVVMLYAMQVGQQHLEDAGYNKRSVDEGEELDDEEGDTDLDQQLAPWNITKNFLASCKGGAMLEIHGEGDPTGRGEALSMIRTSMKGGFKAIGQSIEDRLSMQKQKETGGHKYNVQKQHEEYTDAIRRVWESQARALSSADTYDDTDLNGVEDAAPNGRAGTPGSVKPNRRRDDESASMFSSGSNLEQNGKVLKITRNFRNDFAEPITSVEVVRDPRVIREYQKRRIKETIGAKSSVSVLPECRS